MYSICTEVEIQHSASHVHVHRELIFTASMQSIGISNSWINKIWKEMMLLQFGCMTVSLYILDLRRLHCYVHCP